MQLFNSITALLFLRMYMYNVLLSYTAILTGISAQEALQAFANGNSKFTSDVLQQLVESESGNIVVNPLSAQIVLALLTEGAKGSTAQELQRGLSLPSSKSITEAAVKSLVVSFNTVPDILRLANKIYVAQTFKVETSFKSIATNIYGAGVQNVNFGNNLATANLINNWIASQTNNLIQDLISPNQLNANTKMVLVNTLYFKANWTTPFAPHKTTKGTFYSSNNKSDQIDFMQSADFATYGYFHCGFLEAKFLEIPYRNINASMVVILPDARDGVSQIHTNLADYLKPHKFAVERVNVKLPKFSISTEIDFIPILEKFGIERVFNLQEADLSGISSESGLYVDFVLQKAFINVTETGTEAAAATTVGVGTTAIAPPPNLSFIADHTFFYYIKDNNSGVILFIGRFNK